MSHFKKRCSHKKENIFVVLLVKLIFKYGRFRDKDKTRYEGKDFHDIQKILRAIFINTTYNDLFSHIVFDDIELLF